MQVSPEKYLLSSRQPALLSPRSLNVLVSGISMEVPIRYGEYVARFQALYFVQNYRSHKCLYVILPMVNDQVHIPL